MKYFITSDPHGHFTEMMEAINESGFDENNPDHHLIIGGDLFDRGTENIKILDYVHALLIKEKITLIKGNHDAFFYSPEDLVWNYKNNGFNTTVDEFLGDIEARTLRPYEILNTILEKHPKLSEVLRHMVDKLKIGKYVITHGGLDLNGVPDYWNNTERWIKSGNNDDDGNIYIFGHWYAYSLYERISKVYNDDEPFIYKNYIGLDSAVALFKKMFVYIIEE